MNRITTVFLFVICAVGVAVAVGQRQGSSNASNDVAIKSFTLTASDGVKDDKFGESAAISGDTVVVGAVFAANKKGAAYIFVKSPNGWTDMTQVAELTASDGHAGDDFGGSVAISGNTIVVGAKAATVNGNRNQGAAYVFVEPAGGWSNMTETAKLTASDAPLNIEFGQAASMTGDTIVIGAPYPAGAAYVFVKPQGGWKNMSETAELTSSDLQEGDFFGVSASINANAIVVGAWTANAERGAGYVFVEPQNGWTNMTETAKLTASDGMKGDSFGVSVSITGNTIAVGAFNHLAGRAYVFVEPNQGWVNMTQTAEFMNGISGSCFGSSISMYGNAMLVGADCLRQFTGAAFLFLKPAMGWHNTSTYKAELWNASTFQGGEFGVSLAMQGNTAVVGALNAPTIPPCCQAGPGEAFIFTAQ